MKSTLTLFIAFLLTTSTSFGQVWTEMDTLPSGNGLLGPFAFSINGMLYVGGGYNGIIALNTFSMYDPSTNLWTPKANLPTAIYATHNFVLNGKGYIACGALPGPTNLVYMYDPSTDIWTPKNNFPSTARENGVGFSFNGKGYLSGGFIGGSSVINDMWQYNDSTDTWTQMANVPGPGRNGPQYLVVNNQAFVGMGGDVSTANVFADFYMFNPDSNTYTPVASIPEARAGGANFTFGNYGYIGLGQIVGGMVNDFYKYNPSANTWTLEANFGGVARAHVFNATVAGVPYVGCGSTTTPAYLSDNWAFTYPAGIQNMGNPNSTIKCYPSPASGGFTIDISGYKTGEKQISIYDQLGQLVYQTLSSQNKIQVSNQLSAGLYTVSVIQGTYRGYARVVVE